MIDTTPTAGRVWKRMTFEQRHRAARAFWRDETGAAERAQAVQLIAQHMKSRPKSVAALDEDRRARYLASVPIMSDAMAARVLMLYHLAEQRPLMGAFLDALGIEHDNGMIRADDAMPDAARVSGAAAAIAGAYPAADVSIYLNTLLSQDPATWSALSGLPQLEAETPSGGRT